MKRLVPCICFALVSLAATLARAAVLDSPLTHVVAADTGPLLVETKIAAIVFSVAAVILGVLLYVIPVRAVAATRRSVETAMKQHALTLQEEDRRRIARELHDGAGQALTAARLQLTVLRAGAADHGEVIGQIIHHVDEAIEEVRRSTSALAPPALAELGLLAALRGHCQTFSAASGLTVRCELPEETTLIPAYIETALYRITQEALSNAARHGGATHAWVRLAIDSDQAQLEIGDDGTGIVDRSKRGFGLESIQERARNIGGQVKVIDDAGPGVRVRVRLGVAELGDA